MADFQSPPLNRQKFDYNLRDLLDLHTKEIMLSLNCHAIAKVETFDSSKQTITASIQYTKTFQRPNSSGIYEAVQVQYPLLVDCPVVVSKGAGAALTMPIASGDFCLIAFNDRDIDNWFHTGQVGTLNSNRLHAFSDCIAIVGLFPSTSPLANYDSVRAVLRNQGVKVAVGTSKVEISNGTYDLNTLLQELLTELQNLTTAIAAITVTGVTTGGGVSGVPANAAAITAIGTQISATATKIGGLLE